MYADPFLAEKFRNYDPGGFGTGYGGPGTGFITTGNNMGPDPLPEDWESQVPSEKKDWQGVANDVVNVLDTLADFGNRLLGNQPISQTPPVTTPEKKEILGMPPMLGGLLILGVVVGGGVAVWKYVLKK